jgi:hypothetical protein
MPQADLRGDDEIKLAGVTMAAPGIGGAVRELYRKEIIRIVREHGWSSFESTKHGAAIHEAGHVVVSTMIGDRPKCAWIRKLTDGWDGMTETRNGAFYEAPGVRVDSGTKINKARSLIAGFAAEKIFDADFREGSSIDEIIMSQAIIELVARESGIDAREEWNRNVWNWTLAVLFLNRDVLSEIAAYLYDHHRIDSKPLREFRARILAMKSCQPQTSSAAPVPSLPSHIPVESLDRTPS